MANKTKTAVNINTVLLTVIAVLLAILVGIFAVNRTENHSMHSMMDSSESSSKYSKNEIMFAAMMVPHHEQAVTMSKLALTNTSNPAILDLAKRIKAAQEPEIVQMYTWFDGGYSMMGHDGHEMGGMLSEEELAKLETLKDKEFDQMFLTSMIKHHEGAIEMTQMIVNSDNTEVKTLANNIIKSQTKEIQEMKDLLAKSI